MPKVFVSHNALITPLGFDVDEVFDTVLNGRSAIKRIDNPYYYHQPIFAAAIDDGLIEGCFPSIESSKTFTRLERMMILAIDKVLIKTGIELTDKVGLVISTTKGNIDVLDQHSAFDKKRAYLSEMAKIVSEHFNFKTQPIIVSNACVSGLQALSIAKNTIDAGHFNQVVVVSGDLLSEFVISGFQSFQAMSAEPCRPYSINRCGISLGEATACALVTSETSNLADEAVQILGTSTQNDANHISGPSRTGEGLYLSVKNALNEATSEVSDIDYISAHGTATIFNDEMEAIAFDRLQMNHIPMNSFKAVFGHTLGSSGLLETILAMHSAKMSTLLPSVGFDILGVSKSLNIIAKAKKQAIDMFLKTASGFGGSNTAIIFRHVKSERI